MFSNKRPGAEPEDNLLTTKQLHRNNSREILSPKLLQVMHEVQARIRRLYR